MQRTLTLAGTWPQAHSPCGPSSADVCLVVGGRPFRAHRLILAARCDYFKRLFAGGFADSGAQVGPQSAPEQRLNGKLHSYVFRAVGAAARARNLRGGLLRIGRGREQGVILRGSAAGGRQG